MAMFRGIFTNVSDKEKNDAIERIISHAAPRPDFFLMMILSVAMASFGILLNSIVILIGSMLIAPMLYPTLSLSLGFITADQKIIGRSVSTLLKSAGLAVAAGFVVGIIFSSGVPGDMPLLALIANGQQSLLYAIVAAIAGLAASFALAKPYLNEALPGVAVAVALVPPLAAAGIALSRLEWTHLINSIVLFFANVAGIVFAGLLVFSLLRLAVKQKVAEQAVKQEDKIIKKEEQQATQTQTQATTKTNG